MQKRTILHLDLDTFFVSVERLKNSKLNGVPLIIGGSSGRGVVAACSYETRHFGVRSGMPMRMANMLCPQALVISGDGESYSQYSHAVTDIIKDQAPVFEKASIDEFYVDMTGMDRFFGSWKWSLELKQKILKETGLPVSFGLSINKLVSKIGTGEAKPNGQLQIPFGNEEYFLAPLSVQKIPGVGPQTFQTLTSMGVRLVKTLQNIPPKMLEAEFGKHGRSLYHKSHGVDNSPVETFNEQKSISTERTFQTDTTDMSYLKSMLNSMTERLGFELRNDKKLTACVTVKIRYTDFNTVSQQRRIPYTANDHVLTKVVHDLFEKLYKRRILIRLLGVRFSHLVHGHPQISLFDDDPTMIKLYQKVDKIKSKYGINAVLRAKSLY